MSLILLSDFLPLVFLYSLLVFFCLVISFYVTWSLEFYMWDEMNLKRGVFSKEYSFTVGRCLGGVTTQSGPFHTKFLTGNFSNKSCESWLIVMNPWRFCPPPCPVLLQCFDTIGFGWIPLVEFPLEVQSYWTSCIRKVLKAPWSYNNRCPAHLA